MFDIYHNDGTKLGTIPLSEKSQALLDDGEYVTILYHTPQLLRDQLGDRKGYFALFKDDISRIVTDNPDKLTEYLQLQSAIEAVTRIEAAERAKIPPAVPMPRDA